MRICDKCKSDTSVKILRELRTDSEYDLCEKCWEEFLVIVSEPKRGPGRPKKIDGTN